MGSLTFGRGREIHLEIVELRDILSEARIHVQLVLDRKPASAQLLRDLIVRKVNSRLVDLKNVSQVRDCGGGVGKATDDFT